MRSRRTGGQEGFTLLELMMVMLIISILVSIAVVSYSFTVTRFRSTACRSNLKIIREAIEAYNAKEGSYPPSLEVLVPDYIGEGFDFRCPTGDEYGYEYDPLTGTVKCTNPKHGEF